VFLFKDRFESLLYPLINKAPIRGAAMFVCLSSSTAGWTLNGKRLPANAKVMSNNLLFITEIRLDNAGIYACHGTHRSRKPFSLKADLVVYGKVWLSITYALCCLFEVINRLLIYNCTLAECSNN